LSGQVRTIENRAPDFVETYMKPASGIVLGKTGLWTVRLGHTRRPFFNRNREADRARKNAIRRATGTKWAH
jgi:hypothetical protein